MYSRGKCHRDTFLSFQTKCVVNILSEEVHRGYTLWRHQTLFLREWSWQKTDASYEIRLQWTKRSLTRDSSRQGGCHRGADRVEQLTDLHWTQDSRTEFFVVSSCKNLAGSFLENSQRASWGCWSRDGHETDKKKNRNISGWKKDAVHAEDTG